METRRQLLSYLLRDVFRGEEEIQLAVGGERHVVIVLH